jgi:hypothetical protein
VINRFSKDGSSLNWPTRRLAAWGATNNINSIADAQTWLTNNVTTLAQARTVLLELVVAMVQMSTGGD